MAAWMLHGLCFGKEAGARNLVFSGVKWLQATMKGTSCVRRVRLRSFRLHACCMGYVFLLKFLLKSASKSSFCRFGVEIRFWSCNFRHLACSSIVFCNSVSADRIVVAASRLLGVAAACVILVSFAAEDRKSYWNGCIKAAKVICQQIFSLLALIIFLLKFLLKSASKSSFCRFGVGIRFWSCNFRHLACSSIVFCNSVSADRIVVAASRLLGAAAACVILLSFAAEHRKSYWSGCIQGAKVICQQIFSISALIIFLLKFLLKSASKSSFCRFGVEIRSGSISDTLHVVLLCFATQSLQIAL